MDRRQQILSAALELFAEHGLDGATNEEIAERAGVTPGLIYFYFRSKDDLFLAAFEHQASLAVSALDWAAVADSDEPLAVVVRRMVTRFVDLMEAPRMASLLCVGTRVLVHGGQPADKRERVRCAVREQVLPMQEALERFLQARIARGEVPPLNVTVASHLMIGGLAAVLLRHRTEGVPALAREEIVDTIVHILLHGLPRMPRAREPGSVTASGADLAPTL
jgi:AcrR family transcriptional regulator